jgi:hypothetical protein
MRGFWGMTPQIKILCCNPPEGTPLAQTTSSGIKYAKFGCSVWVVGELLKEKERTRKTVIFHPFVESSCTADFYQYLQRESLGQHY